MATSDIIPPASGDSKTHHLTEAELNALRDRFRAEERERVRTEIEGLNQKVTTLSGIVQERDQTITSQKQEIATITASVKDTAGGKAVDIPALVAEVTGKVREQVNRETAERLSSLEAQVGTLKTERDRLAVSNHRSTMLADARQKGVHVIEEMVQGNTKEELDQSFLRAQEAYSRYVPLPSTPATSPGTPPAAPVAPQPVAHGPSPVVDPAHPATITQPSQPVAETPIAEILRQIETAPSQAKRAELYVKYRDELRQHAAQDMAATGGSVLVGG